MKYIPTEKFTDTSIVIRAILPLEKETITALNVLLLMFRGRTQKYDTKEKFSRLLNSTYAMKVVFGLTGYGQYVGLDTRFQYIRSDYIDDPGYTDQVLDIIQEVLDHPLLDEKAFCEACYLLHDRLVRAYDDPESLALLQGLQNTNDTHSISILVQGSLEDLEHLTLQDVKEVYARLKAAPVLISVCGHGDEKIMDWLKSRLQETPVLLERNLVPAAPAKRISTTRQISQSALVQVWATSIDIQDPLYYPLLVANSILGQGPMSLLFEEIREKHSYCYSVSSMLLRFDGALLIFCGCKKEHLEHVSQLIDAQVHRLQTGDFDDSRIEIAKKDLMDTLVQQSDRPFGMMEQYLFDTLLHRSHADIEQRFAQIQAVSREQIMEAASRLHLLMESIVQEGNENEVQS